MRMISGGKWAPLKLIAIVALPLFVLDHLRGRSYPKGVPNENLRQNRRGRGTVIPPVGELRHVNDQLDTQALLIGAVDDVARGLRAYRGKGCVPVFGAFDLCAGPVKKRRSMEVFAKELLPEKKTW